MIKAMTGLAAAGLIAFAMGGTAQAQERTFRKLTSGPAANIHGAMTQSQARAACRREMRGARESRSAMRKKMSICMNDKMNGN